MIYLISNLLLNIVQDEDTGNEFAATLAIVLTILLVLSVISIAVYIQIEKWRQQKRQAMLAEMVTKSQITSPETQGLFIRSWVAALESEGYLTSLQLPHTGLALGYNQNGRQAILLEAANRINRRFPEDNQLAIYVDMRQLIARATIYHHVSVENLYHQMMNLPFTWYRTIAQQGDKSAQSLLMNSPRYRKKKKALQKALNFPLAELNTLHIRRALYDWMDDCQIQTIVIFADHFSELSEDEAILLLEMFKRTFSRDGRILLKLGANPENMVFSRRTNEGQVGMQVHNDMIIDINLLDLLTSQDTAPTLFDPRQRCLLTVLKVSMGHDIPLVLDEQPDWNVLFQPPTLWHELFEVAEHNIYLIGLLIQELAPVWKQEQKVTKKILSSGWDRIVSRL